ncbi:MAG: hypothetical protein ACLUD2_08905 [Clostridium sp.]
MRKRRSPEGEVEYSLDINYDHVSDCRIVLDVTSKGCAKLELGEA